MHLTAYLTLPLATERLILRPFRDEDLATLVAYRSDPEVARYQSWSTPYDPADGKALIETMHATRPGTPGAWYQVAIARQDSGVHIGDCAFCVMADRPGHAEIGYSLARDQQGFGFATEAVGRLIAALFDELGMEQVQAMCDTENAASVRLLERLGMQLGGYFCDSFWDGAEWRSEYAYTIRRTAR